MNKTILEEPSTVVSAVMIEPLPSPLSIRLSKNENQYILVPVGLFTKLVEVMAIQKAKRIIIEK